MGVCYARARLADCKMVPTRKRVIVPCFLLLLPGLVRNRESSTEIVEDSFDQKLVPVVTAAEDDAEETGLKNQISKNISLSQNDRLKRNLKGHVIYKQDNRIKKANKAKIWKNKKRVIRLVQNNKKGNKRHRNKNKKTLKGRKKKRGHPRKELDFDNSCECGKTKTQRIVNGVES